MIGMNLKDIKFPELKKRELGILIKRHYELFGQHTRQAPSTVEKMETYLTISLVTATETENNPFKTAWEAWLVIWPAIAPDAGWEGRDYQEKMTCFQIAATNVLRLIS